MGRAPTSEAQRYVVAVEKASKEVPAFLMEIAEHDKKAKTLQDGVRVLPVRS